MSTGRAVVFAAAIFLIIAVSAPGQESKPPTEFPSKDDARLMFGMTRDQWSAKVATAVESGAARVTGNPETGYGMAMDTAEGDLLVVWPIYTTTELKPGAIQVTVGYRQPRAGRFPTPTFEEAIATVTEQMAPEYFVSGEVKATPGNITIVFIIVENTPG